MNETFDNLKSIKSTDDWHWTVGDDYLTAQKINQQLPSEISVDLNNTNRWHWYFRSVSSEDYEETENGFDTPVDALCSLTNYMIEGSDDLIEKLYKVSD